MKTNHVIQQSTLSQRAQAAGGQPISHLMALALARPELISLAAGFVDQATLPCEATKAALDALWADPQAARAALQYGSTPGHEPLRELLLERLRAADGHPASEAALSIDQVVVTAGSNEFLHVVGDTLLDPGDIVLCSAPSYFVFLGMLANLGARSVGIASDEQGMIPEALEVELARLELEGELPRVKAIYLTSYYDNPCSVTLAEARRGRIVEAAKRWSRTGRIYVIEDTAYRDLRYEGEDVPSLRAYDEEGDTVILTGTFSKSFSPGIRVGWGMLPAELVAPVCDQKGNIDFGSPNFAQHLMHKVAELGLLEPQIERVCAGYRVKRAAMLEACDQHLAGLPETHWIRPSGGLYVWLTLPEAIDAGEEGPLLQRALESGVLYVPGAFCYPQHGICKKNTIRLSFGVQTPDKIVQGIAALARAVTDILRK